MKGLYASFLVIIEKNVYATVLIFLDTAFYTSKKSLDFKLSPVCLIKTTLSKEKPFNLLWTMFKPNSTLCISTQPIPTIPNPTQLNSTQLNLTKPNSTQPNSKTKPNPTQINSIQLSSTQSNLTHPNST